MRLIIKTKNKNIYYVQFPNFLDQEKIPAILEEAKWVLPKNEEILEHHVHSDQFTDQERKQLDIYGEIKYPMIQLEVDLELI